MYLLIDKGDLLLGRYVAELITTVCRTCWRHLSANSTHTELFCMQLMQAYKAESSCNRLLLNLLCDVVL